MSIDRGRSFNSDMLKLAREYNDISQTQLSTLIGVSQPKLSKIESGLIIPEEEEVKIIANTLDFPIDFFVQPGSIFPPMTPFHRKRVSMSKHILAKAEAIGNIQRIQITHMLSQIEIQENTISLEVDGEEEAKEAATTIRNFYKLPRGPIHNMTDLLEDNGIFVSSLDLFSPKIDGFTLLGDGRYNPIVFVNNQFPGDKIRLTLAHELGHIVMHNYQHENVEKEAWSFANEFLMPENEIRSDLRGITNIRQLLPLKLKWRVSMMALIHRAGDLKVIAPRTITYLYQQMAPYRRIEPANIPVEKPGLIKEVLDMYRNQLKYNEEELKKLLKINENLFDELYRERRPRIKMIRTINIG